MELSALVSAFVTLFVIIDPVGLTPLYASLTQGQTPAGRRAIAVRSLGIAFGILVLFTLLGEAVMGFVGITMPAFRIAGGVLLFLTALEMLFEKRTKRREGQASPQELPDPSVFPLATPLLAGPGAITTVILLAGQQDSYAGLAAIVAVEAALLFLVFGFFLTAAPLERFAGKTGINVITRLLGMLLAALSVQFVLDGLRDFGLAG
ncbi:MarC family protein [Pseudooceanicola sp. C21-150M6]|uniref:MarC family protein n=1 Tax=Pseudooceanicola sp. C21-150M6 TaxID=3434355 RepID=UPI003D7F841B